MGGKTGKPECDELLQDVADLIHGELHEERAAEVRAHLETCPPCFETADFQAHFLQLVAKRCTEEVPDSFRARIVAMFQAPGTDSAAPPASS